MNNVDCSELIHAVTDVGYVLLYNGAEIYRVEESMQRIYRAYGLDGGEVFAIPTCIFTTVNDSEGKPITYLRRIFGRTTNLDKVEKANGLCRRICYTTPDVESIRREIKEIDSRPTYGFLELFLGFVLTSFGFTLFYGGNLLDGCCAGLCGAAIRIVVHFMSKFKANAFFMNIAASCVAAIIAMTSVHFGFGTNLDKIIIGAMMNLVPGIVITAFMRDIMAGDLIAGLIRFVESFLVATAIAIGAGIALLVPRLLWGV